MARPKDPLNMNGRAGHAHPPSQVTSYCLSTVSTSFIRSELHSQIPNIDAERYSVTGSMLSKSTVFKLIKTFKQEAFNMMKHNVVMTLLQCIGLLNASLGCSKWYCLIDNQNLLVFTSKQYSFTIYFRSAYYKIANEKQDVFCGVFARDE